MFYYILVIIGVLVAYASLYFIFKEEIVIHQTDVENFDFSLLYAKQPLVIEDSVANVNQLIDLWFSANIVQDVYPEKVWNRNAHKYLVIYASDDVSEITLYHPSKKLVNDMPEDDDSMMTIRLKNKKILIVPYKWHYNIAGNAEIYGIHDYITYVLAKVV